MNECPGFILFRSLAQPPSRNLPNIGTSTSIPISFGSYFFIFSLKSFGGQVAQFGDALPDRSKPSGQGRGFPAMSPAPPYVFYRRTALAAPKLLTGPDITPAMHPLRISLACPAQVRAVGPEGWIVLRAFYGSTPPVKSLFQMVQRVGVEPTCGRPAPALQAGALAVRPPLRNGAPGEI